MLVSKHYSFVIFPALFLLCSCSQGELAQENNDLHANPGTMKEAISALLETRRQLKDETMRADQAVARATEAEKKVSDLQQQLDRETNDLRGMEKKIRQLYKEIGGEIGLRGLTTEGFPIWPFTRIEGKVLSYSKEFGVVVVNIGKEDGVKDGMQFQIDRPGKFVATATAKKVASRLTVADINLMQVEPQPGDMCAKLVPLVRREESGNKTK